jgi:hypothetical protein
MTRLCRMRRRECGGCKRSTIPECDPQLLYVKLLLLQEPSDDEALQDEEEEVRRLQAQQAAGLDDDDYGLPGSSKQQQQGEPLMSDLAAAGAGGVEVETVAKDLGALTAGEVSIGDNVFNWGGSYSMETGATCSCCSSHEEVFVRRQVSCRYIVRAEC